MDRSNQDPETRGTRSTPVLRSGFWVSATLVGLVVVSSGAAQAQPFGGVWGGYYEEEAPRWAYGPPPGAYPPADGYPAEAPSRREGAVPLREISRRVEAAGLHLIAPPRHNGRIYLAEAEDQRGQRRRLVFDAYEGTLISNTSLTTGPKQVARQRPDEPPMKPAARPLPSEATKSPLGPKSPPAAAMPAHAKASPGVPSALQPATVPSAPPAPPAPAPKAEPPHEATPAPSSASSEKPAPAAPPSPAAEPAPAPTPAPVSPEPASPEAPDTK